MGSWHVTGSQRIRRRSIIKLSPAERAALEHAGCVVLARPVEWPIPDRLAFMDRAYADTGGADFGPGPYLKVPNREAGEDAPDDEVVSRVFCPWGYPPDPLRAFRRNLRMRLERVDLVQVAPAAWEWRPTAKMG